MHEKCKIIYRFWMKNLVCTTWLMMRMRTIMQKDWKTSATQNSNRWSVRHCQDHIHDDHHRRHHQKIFGVDAKNQKKRDTVVHHYSRWNKKCAAGLAMIYDDHSKRITWDFLSDFSWKIERFCKKCVRRRLIFRSQFLLYPLHAMATKINELI